MPTAGNNLLKIVCLIRRAAPQQRDCTCVEETMKQLCLGVVVAISLTLPAFGQGVDPNLLSGFADAASQLTVLLRLQVPENERLLAATRTEAQDGVQERRRARQARQK
jgi:hypothetical protein